MLVHNNHNSIPNNYFIYTQTNGSKYFYVISLIQFRLTVKGFQVLLFKTDYSIQYCTFVCIQLNGYLGFMAYQPLFNAKSIFM